MPTAEAFLGVLPFNIKGTSSPIPRRRNPNQGSSINDRFSRLFKHRGSRVIHADVDQQRTRVDRTCISELETHYLQQQSTEILLQNDFAMARLLCKLDLSGDKAAAMASHLISFLRGNPQTADHVESFVIGAFDSHLTKYAAVSSNPRNVLRDNNLATMLVVCYLQQTCRSYLVSILQPVMSAIAPYVESCELDPVRLAQSQDPSASSRNLYNLYCVCRSVLDAVFSAGKHAPPVMRRLCTLIRGRIEVAWNMALPATPTHAPVHAPALAPVPAALASTPNDVPSAKSPAADSRLPMLELWDWEKDLKSTVQADIMTDIKSALDQWLQHPESSASDSPDGPMPTPDASHPFSGPDGGAIGLRANDAFDKEARRSFAKMMSSPFASTSKLDSSMANSGTQTPTASDSKESWRQTHNLPKNMGSAMPLHLSKHASRRYSGSYFSPVETVISMLIFVRFFIPILTAPDTYGIDVKMSPENRRGMLLCAKFVAVLCNGVSFGAKVPYLVPMNGLLREYRPKLRQYLHSISSGSRGVSSAADDADHMSEDEESDGDMVTIDELASQFQVITMSAQIGTKEEQRKSRMSLLRGVHLSGRAPGPDIVDWSGMPLPPLPQMQPLPPLPPIPPLPMRPQATKPAPRPEPAIDEYVVPASRATIDIPCHRPTAPLAAMAGSSSSPAAAVTSSAPDSLLDSEPADESLVTIDFLLCLESSYGKLEALASECAAGDDALETQRLRAACRELKPIVHYAKHLSSPSRVAGTSAISSSMQTGQEPGRRFGFPFGSQNASRTSEEFVDVLGGHRRTSTLPGNYKFQ
ncbi:hypothetical protein GGI04_003971 [Coemansia thaxteri]|nr:hypothetical protein GGI04_003971 [Coemansia thaxteri]